MLFYKTLKTKVFSYNYTKINAENQIKMYYASKHHLPILQPQYTVSSTRKVTGAITHAFLHRDDLTQITNFTPNIVIILQNSLCVNVRWVFVLPTVCDSLPCH